MKCYSMKCYYNYSFVWHGVVSEWLRLVRNRVCVANDSRGQQHGVAVGRRVLGKHRKRSGLWNWLEVFPGRIAGSVLE